MKRKLLSAAAVVLSVFLLCSCGKYSKGDKLVEEGKKYYDEQDYSAAVKTLKEAENETLKAAKPHVLYFYLGESYFKLGAYTNSIEAHKKVLEIKPDTFKSYVTIGVCERKLGHDKEAFTYYNKALLYDPQNADSVGLYISLGSVYIESDKPYTAIDYLEKATEIYPEHPAAHAYLAIAYTMAYEYDKGENELALAVANRYENAEEVRARINEIKNIHASIPQVINKNQELPNDGG